MTTTHSCFCSPVALEVCEPPYAPRVFYAYTYPTVHAHAVGKTLCAQHLCRTMMKQGTGCLEVHGADFSDASASLWEYRDALKSRVFDHVGQNPHAAVVLVERASLAAPGVLDVLAPCMRSTQPQLSYVVDDHRVARDCSNVCDDDSVGASNAILRRAHSGAACVTTPGCVHPRCDNRGYSNFHAGGCRCYHHNRGRLAAQCRISRALVE